MGAGHADGADAPRPHMTAYTGSMAVVQMANKQQHLQRTRHLNIKRHFLKDEVAEGRLSVRHVGGKENSANIFTKPLARVLFERFRIMPLGIC